MDDWETVSYVMKMNLTRSEIVLARMTIDGCLVDVNVESFKA